jgi:hypothetical protein
MVDAKKAEATAEVEVVKWLLWWRSRVAGKGDSDECQWKAPIFL